MKKLMIALMALTFLTATVGVSFARDDSSTAKKTGGHKKKTKSTAPTVIQ
jgi:hypothetical protein